MLHDGSNNPKCKPRLTNKGSTINKEKSIMKHNADNNGSSAVLERSQSQSPQRPDADKEAMMKRMEAAGTPGPAHKALDVLVGNWKAEVKCWMEPGGAPNVSQATAKTSWVLNGHFVEEEF